MGNQAKVLDPGIFDELKAALTKFESEAGDSVSSAERAIQETRNWLEERFEHWSSEVNRRKRELEHAQDALKRCQSSAQSSNSQEKKEQQKDCSAEAHAVVQAKRALEEAEANLKVTKKWKDDFANRESNFRMKAHSFTKFVNSEVASGKNEIQGLKDVLDLYTGKVIADNFLQSAALHDKKLMGAFYNEFGYGGETIAREVLRQEYGIQINGSEVHADSLQGVDVEGHTKYGDGTVAAEVKTTMDDRKIEKVEGHGFQVTLSDDAYGGVRQMSEAWFEHAPSSMGDHTSSRKLGVFINAKDKTVSIYRRIDDEATTWKNLIRNKPLSDYGF